MAAYMCSWDYGLFLRIGSFHGLYVGWIKNAQTNRKLYIGLGINIAHPVEESKPIRMIYIAYTPPYPINPSNSVNPLCSIMHKSINQNIDKIKNNPDK